MVMMIANTPSLKASTRFLSIAAKGNRKTAVGSIPDEPFYV